MPFVALTIALLLTQPKGINGPSLSIPPLKSAKLVYSEVGTNWANGCYDVTLIYTSPKNANELAKAYSAIFKEGRLERPGVYSGYRTVGDVMQRVLICRLPSVSLPQKQFEAIHKAFDGKPTFISITETPGYFSSPKSWFKKAVGSKPPVPLIDVPFLAGTKTQTVMLTDLNYLLSGSGHIMLTKATDAAIYRACVARTWHAVMKDLADWASKHGYKSTQWMSYFKANTEIFEIELTSLNMGGKPGTMITIYTSKKPVRTPVARMKG